MTLADFLLITLVAIVCGTISQVTSSYSRGGWIVNWGVGFIGALAGVAVSRSLDAPIIYDIKYRMVDFPIIYSIIGSALSLAAIGFLVKPHRR
jgi:uncharacterized membrane protein YeaQ/YmgE (transglycosylase-associated protein family)